MYAERKLSLSIMVLSALIISLSLTACSPKFISAAGQKPGSGDAAAPDAADNTNILVTPVDKVELKEPPVMEGSLEGDDHWALPELAELKQATACYFDPDSAYYMGEDAQAVFKEYLYTSKLLDEPIPAEHWETLLRSLFLFRGSQEADTQMAMYTQNLLEDGKLTRETAVSGLMKLISIRYRIPLGGDSEAWKASDSLTDIQDCGDKHEPLVRMAYAEGLTDKSIEDTFLIRPQDPLTYGEALSMVSRVIRKYGLPPAGSPETPPTADVGYDECEWMITECEDYYKIISSSEDALSKRKLEMLKTAESLLNPGRTADTLNAVVTLEQWQVVLTDALGLSEEEVKAYTLLNQGQDLTYDIVAISLFKLGFRLGAFEIRDATAEEIQEARRLVPTLDQAMDLSKFTQMVSSGLLRGISQKSGFSPTSPVTSGEAMLLVKRTVEAIK